MIYQSDLSHQTEYGSEHHTSSHERARTDSSIQKRERCQNKREVIPDKASLL